MWWAAVTSVVKGFFQSVWGALRQRRQDAEKEHVANLKVQDKSYKARIELEKKKRKVQDDLPDRNNLDDILDSFDDK